MDLKEALKITGFVLCEFRSDGEDECSCCDKPIPKGGAIYYERTSYEYDEGEYYCEKCTIDTPERWDDENDCWTKYAESIRLGQDT